jgi:Fe-S-cluster containining protein
MEVNCEGCAGCCVDWRPLRADAPDHERRGGRRALDDTYNLAPLTRDEVRDLCADGLADALTPRLWAAEDDDAAVRVDGEDVVAVDGRPVFAVGLRKPPKPVAPFDADRTWLRTCVFLDPETLRCRIHGDEHYPRTCRTYPSHNLLLGVETECERVETAFGGRRLLDATPPADDPPPPFGPQALGATVFTYPDPDELDGVVDRLRRGETTPADRAAFVGVAVGSHPGSLDVDADRAATWRERALSADSWVGTVVDTWRRTAAAVGSPAPEVAFDETTVGAPGTVPWSRAND